MDNNDKTESLFTRDTPADSAGAYVSNDSPSGNTNIRCTECGEYIPYGDIYCANCGTPVSVSPYQTPAQTRMEYAPYAATQQPVAHTSANADQPSPYAAPAPYSPQVDSPAAYPSPESYSQPAAYPQQAAYQPPHYGYPPPHSQKTGKKQSRIAIILSIVAVLTVLLGAGLYYFLFLRNNSEQETPPPPSAETPQPGGIQQPDDPPPAPSPEPAQPVEVRSINITSGALVVSEIQLIEGEAVTLRALIEPADAIADIVWTSGNTQVFTIAPAGADGYIATLNAISGGSATLTVTAGRVTNTCEITVFDAYTPPTAGPPGTNFGSNLIQIYNEMENRNSGVHLLITWTDGPHSGNQSALYREAGSNIWMMDGVSSVREVFPAFGYDSDAYIISWPRLTTSERRYYLFENGTGYFAEPDGSDRENLRWAFWVN